MVTDLIQSDFPTRIVNPKSTHKKERKIMKKAFAMILAIMMVLSLAATAFAAEDTTTLSVNTEGYAERTFNAYRVLTATNDGEAFNYEVVPAFRAALASALEIDTTDKTDAVIDNAILEGIAALTTGDRKSVV